MNELTLSELFNHPIINIDKQSRFSSIRIRKQENVAEHSSIVANISIILSSYINYLEGSKVIDIKEVAYKSVIHDYAEAYYCDIATDIKYCDDRLKPLLDEIEENLLKNSLGEFNGLVNDVMNSKDDTIEGCIVSVSDKLHALFTLIKEFKLQDIESIKKAVVYCSDQTLKSILYLSKRPEINKSRTALVNIHNSLYELLKRIKDQDCYV